MLNGKLLLIVMEIKLGLDYETFGGINTLDYFFDTFKL